MKKLVISLALLSSLSASASLTNGVFAVMQILEGQQMAHAVGVKDKSDPRSTACTVEIFSDDEDHIAVYVKDAGKRIGASTGFSDSDAQITFKDNKIIVQNMANKSIISLDQNNIVKKVEVRSMYALGSVSRSLCEFY